MRKTVALSAALVLTLFGVIYLVGRLLATRALENAAASWGATASAQNLSLLPGRISFGRVTLPPLGTVDEIRISFPILPLFLLRVDAHVSLSGADLRLHSRPTGQTAPEKQGRVRISSAQIKNSHVVLEHEAWGMELAGNIDASWRRGKSLEATLTKFSATLRAGPRLEAHTLTLTRLPDHEWPLGTILGGRLILSPGLDLGHIEGKIAPQPGDAVDLDLGGGYGDSTERLWSASGRVWPKSQRVELRVRGEKFRLDRLASLLQDLPLGDLHDTEIGGDLELKSNDGQVSFEGSVRAAGVTLASTGIAAQPIDGISAEARVRGRIDMAKGTLELEENLVRVGSVTAEISVGAEHLRANPVFEARLRIPPIDCQAVLDSLPPSLAPRLAGFRLSGQFDADVRARVDLGAAARLRENGEWRRDKKLLEEVVTLEGSVGLAGCHVIEAPADLDAEILKDSFTHTMEITPGHMREFILGSDNPDFVPLREISPHIVGAILTTEDNGFFRHYGFVIPEIRSALARNLVEQRFAYGASSITMQMVKNVLLSHEKTIARKLQEVVLTWYVEKVLPKERILEVYLNAIEFGPGIFGVGRAAHHYFGKRASEITPLQAAFFSSLLPSPKRRYEHYCRGAPSQRWEKYLLRILRRMNERGHLADEDYLAAQNEKLAFDRKEARPERECLDSIRRLVGATAEEPLEELDLPFVESEDEPAQAPPGDLEPSPFESPTAAPPSPP